MWRALQVSWTQYRIEVSSAQDNHCVSWCMGQWCLRRGAHGRRSVDGPRPSRTAHATRDAHVSVRWATRRGTGTGEGSKLAGAHEVGLNDKGKAPADDTVPVAAPQRGLHARHALCAGHTRRGPRQCTSRMRRAYAYADAVRRRAHRTERVASSGRRSELCAPQTRTRREYRRAKGGTGESDRRGAALTRPTRRRSG